MKMKRDISGEFARDARTRSVRSGFRMKRYIFKILMDCETCGVEINTHQPPYCLDCWRLRGDDEE